MLASAVAILVVRPRPIAANILPSEEITVDGETRSVRLVVPHALRKPAPIVFAFHGMGESNESMAKYSRLDQLAALHGFILVYPAARRTMWATVAATSDNIGANLDVRFFDELLAHLTDRYDIDHSRAYVVGMSNGATFVQLLAVARPDEIAAVVAHSGSKPRDIGSSTIPTPVMLIVGADDLASHAMQSDAKQYRAEGRVVEFVSVPGLGHEWSARHNDQIWRFLSEHSLAAQSEKNAAPVR